MTRDVLTVTAIWALLTAVGELWAVNTVFNPAGFATEAHIVDDAFQLMVLQAMPVFSFVVAVLGYSVWRFRAPGDPPEDGPPVTGHRAFTLGWLAVTSGLTAVVIINPGIKGMMELRHEHPTELTVNVVGLRWAWMVTYPDQELTATELVLPVGKRVRFDVTSTDVIHSFWIPAFRIKIDAVPGLVTTTHATPDRLGSFEEDDGLRLQCAELCGLAHNLMRMPVRVVEQAEFDAWVAQQKAAR
jgi:cytochrome c oxidase subunit 2